MPDRKSRGIATPAYTINVIQGGYNIYILNLIYILNTIQIADKNGSLNKSYMTNL